MKLWIDTDIGGDIDDALALLLALSLKDVEIVGVSTVFENTKKRAKIAKAILNLGGYENVKVYPGIGQPMKATKVFNDEIDVTKNPKTYIDEIFDKCEIETTSAVEALKDYLIHCKEKVTIVTLGALTNIAYLISKYPEATNKIEALYIMGTAIEMNLNEFNISCDPEAAKIVFDSTIKKKVISLDVTFKCELDELQKNKLINCKSDCVKLVMQMGKMWVNTMILHDPLALACAITTDFVTFEAGNLYIETEGYYSRGKSIKLNDFNWQKEVREDLAVSTNVKAKNFTNYYVKQICLLDKLLYKNKGEKL